MKWIAVLSSKFAKLFGGDSAAFKFTMNSGQVDLEEPVVRMLEDILRVKKSPLRFLPPF